MTTNIGITILPPETAAGSGTVTSVGLTMPTEFSVAGSPVTTAGVLAVTKANQNPNLVYAGPAVGAPAQPTFRALVAADMAAHAVTHEPNGSDMPWIVSHVQSVSTDKILPTGYTTVFGGHIAFTGAAKLTLDGTASLRGVS